MEQNNGTAKPESNRKQKLFRSALMIHFLVVAILVTASVPSWAFFGALFKNYYFESHGKRVYVSDKYNAAMDSGNKFARNGQYDEAIAEYTKAIEIGPKYPFAYVNRGMAYFNKGQSDQAISDLNKAIEVDAKFEEGYYIRGSVYLEKGQFDQAISDFTKAIKLKPKFARAYFGRGSAYCQKGQVDLAIPDLNKAGELHVDLRKPVEEEIERCKASKSPPGWVSMIRSVENDFKTGLDLFDTKDYEGAVEKLTTAIANTSVARKMYEASPDALDADKSAKWDSVTFTEILYARSVRSHAYLLLGKYDEAKNDANWVIDYYNKNKPTDEESKKVWKEAVEKAVFVRGAVRQTEGTYQQAIRDFDWVVEKGERFGWQAYERRGRAYLALKDFKTAYAHFDKLVQEYPTSAEYHALRCTTGYESFNSTTFEDSDKGREERNKKSEEMLAVCQRALEIDPKNELVRETADRIALGKAYTRFLEGWNDFLFGVGLFEDEKGKGVSDKNEYGGETLEKIYQKGDAGSEDVIKEIAYYDGNKKKVKTEYFHTDKLANEKGFNRSISYFDSGGKRTKAEYFYTDKFISEKGFYKSISYYDSTGKRTKAESFYTDKFASEKGFNKYVHYLDSTEKVIKKESYMGDKLIKKTE